VGSVVVMSKTALVSRESHMASANFLVLPVWEKYRTQAFMASK
jgi:hypothetical protein